ncbi:hypothetical protein HPB48_021143 [Haemaphysalis longicornis]|uniref:Uncharacterized protein n=1 Tax=Haemaphysalis longicornis TaxID=44386 RepID=A0A9J6GJK8_HAELO|nr:hypothetical protein HPB48_021143 [Haemaphysalis longicornis]
MNPTFHQECRLARANALHKAHVSHPSTLYVDKAEYPDRAACFALVVSSSGDSVAACLVSIPHPEISEVAISWPLQLPRPPL